jgi:hypothetical protein
MKKSECNTKRKFQQPYKIYANCKYCTPEKRHRMHNYCFSLNCTCPHHGNFTALHAREKGLRTLPKPGEPGYVEKKA